MVEPPWNCGALPTPHGFATVTMKVVTRIQRNTILFHPPLTHPRVVVRAVEHAVSRVVWSQQGLTTLAVWKLRIFHVVRLHTLEMEGRTLRPGCRGPECYMQQVVPGMDAPLSLSSCSQLSGWKLSLFFHDYLSGQL